MQPQPAPAQAATPSARAQEATTQTPATQSTAGLATTSSAAGQSSPAQRPKESGTPRAMRRLRAAAAIGCVLTGLTATGFLGSEGYQAAPSSTASQLSHVQRAQGQLLRADAESREDVVRVSLGGASDRAQLDEAADSASAAIGSALRTGNGAAGGTLASVNKAVTTYLRTAERAQANAKTAPAAAAKEIQAAGATLRTSGVERLESVAQSDTQRLVQGPGGGNLARIVGALTTAMLILGALWLAQRTHRAVNPGLLAATLITAGLTWLALNPQTLPGTSVTAVKQADALRDLRTQMYAARTAELDRLAPGATTASADSAWTAAVKKVGTLTRGKWLGGGSDSAASDATRAAWQDYAARHTAVTKATTNASRLAALQASTTQWDKLMTALDADFSATQKDVNAEAGTPALISAGAALLAGLLAAGLAWSGISQRLREFQ